jgi:hypothetical protein
MTVRASNPFEDKKAEIMYQLRHYRSMVANYRACCEAYDQLFPSGTQTLSDMPKAQSDTFEPERWADMRIKQRDNMQRSLNEMREEYIRIADMVRELDADESLILIRRYMLGESMERVARKISYGERWCWNTHNRAIRKLTERELKNG